MTIEAETERLFPFDKYPLTPMASLAFGRSGQFTLLSIFDFGKGNSSGIYQKGGQQWPWVANCQQMTQRVGDGA